MKTWILLIVSVLLLAYNPARAQRAYTRTTVCRVLSLGTSSRVRHVVIKADVMADHMHSALLTDPNCPGKGIFLDVSPDNADQSVAEFDRALWKDGAPGFGDRVLSGTFFGELRIGGKLPLNPGKKKISIALLKVEALSDTHPKDEH